MCKYSSQGYPVHRERGQNRDREKRKERAALEGELAFTWVCCHVPVCTAACAGVCLFAMFPQFPLGDENTALLVLLLSCACVRACVCTHGAWTCRGHCLCCRQSGRRTPRTRWSSGRSRTPPASPGAGGTSRSPGDAAPTGPAWGAGTWGSEPGPGSGSGLEPGEVGTGSGTL